MSKKFINVGGDLINADEILWIEKPYQTSTTGWQFNIHFKNPECRAINYCASEEKILKTYSEAYGEITDIHALELEKGKIRQRIWGTYF